MYKHTVVHYNLLFLFANISAAMLAGYPGAGVDLPSKLPEQLPVLELFFFFFFEGSL